MPIKLWIFTLFLMMVSIVEGSYIPQNEAPEKEFEPIWTHADWLSIGKNRIDRAAEAIMTLKNKQAKNVILFVGDGMGFSTLAASRVLNGQKRNLRWEESYLTMETLPFSGMSRTYSVDSTTPDSASTATAYLGGVKANMGTIGVNEYVEVGKCDNFTDNNIVTSVAKHSMKAGKWVGVVTNTRVTHASPAGVYASIPNRNWESKVEDDDPNCLQVKDIAYQLVHGEDNENIRVILGGGSERFIPKTESLHGHLGKRHDGLNLIQVWEDKRRKDNSTNYSLALNVKDFHAVEANSTDYLFGLFSHNHLDYAENRDPLKEPSLAELTEKAVQILQKSTEGYFLFVEGGRIDHAHHDNHAYHALHDTLAFDEAVKRALELTDSNETLVIVTADHSHVMTFGGYGSSYDSVLGFANQGLLARDFKPYLQIQYANGPGYKKHRMSHDKETSRRNLRGQLKEVLSKQFIQDAGVWLSKETHGGEDVPIFGSGPMAHLIHSAEEQTHIAHVMMYALCVGQYSDQPHCPASAPASASASEPSVSNSSSSSPPLPSSFPSSSSGKTSFELLIFFFLLAAVIIFGVISALDL